MNESTTTAAFEGLSTAIVNDACLRLEVPFDIAPSGIRSVLPGARVAGRARPVRHHGFVETFFEAFDLARPGEVLVIDDGGRTDQSCIGDLAALEAEQAGLAGIVLWGRHRDTRELQEIGLPVFSYGALPRGPRTGDPRPEDVHSAAAFGPFTVTAEQVVFGDEDGVLFVPRSRLEQVLSTAREILLAERRQAERLRAGTPLREQFGWEDYRRRKAAEPGYTFAEHLRARGGAIGE